MNLAPREASLRNVIQLAQKVSDAVANTDRQEARLALLSVYYFSHIDKLDVNLRELLWFTEEGSFQLASLLQALHGDRKGVVQ